MASIVSYYYFLFSEIRYFNYIWLNKFTLYINHLVVKEQKPNWTTKQRGTNHGKRCGHVGPLAPGKDRGVGGGTDGRTWYLNIPPFPSCLCFLVCVSLSCLYLTAAAIGQEETSFFLVSIWKSPERNSAITCRLIVSAHGKEQAAPTVAM